VSQLRKEATYMNMGAAFANMIKSSNSDLQETIQGAVHNISASGMCESIVELINDFESNLDNELEAGIRLVSFGQTIEFHISGVDYRNPNLIVFSGALENGSPVRLVQHMSQLSILLTVLLRKCPDIPRRKIGFSPDCRDD